MKLLSFFSCEEISDIGLNHLKQGLQPLVSLQQLSLKFNQFKTKIEGMNNFSQGTSQMSD